MRSRGELNHWSCARSSGLALVLLLDQFPRQIWLMPQLHSEDISLVRAVIPMLERHVDEVNANVACRHLAEMERFGRHPRRNLALGRMSSPE